MKWNETKPLLDEGKAIRHKDWRPFKRWELNKEGQLVCLNPYIAPNIFTYHFVGVAELRWAKRCSKWEVVE